MSRPLGDSPGPPFVAAAGTAAVFLLSVPGDWSDGGGRPWQAVVAAALGAGVVVALVVNRWFASVLAAPLAALVTYCALASWKAAQVDSLWWAYLFGVFLPVGLLCTFGGSWLVVHLRR